MDWKTSKAPKDGRVILADFGKEIVGLTYWFEDSQEWVIQQVAGETYLRIEPKRWMPWKAM